MVTAVADKVVVELDLALEKFIAEGKRGEAAFAATLDKMVSDGKVTEDQLKQHFENIAKSMSGAGKSAGSDGQKAGKAFGSGFGVGLLKSGLSTLLSGGILAGIVADTKAMGDLEDAARRAGLSLEKIQQITYTLRKEGLTESQAVKDVEKLTKLLADAENNPRNSLRRLFEVNGLTIGGKDMETVLNDLARLMANAPEGMRTKIAEMTGLSEKWIAVLEKGPEEFQKMQREAEVLGKSAFQKAEEFRKAWDEATTRWGDVMRREITSILPLLNTLVTKAIEFVSTVAKVAGIAATEVRNFARMGEVEIYSLDQLELLKRFNEGPLGNKEFLAKIKERIDAIRLSAEAASDSVSRLPRVTINTAGPNTTRLPGPYRAGSNRERDPAEDALRKKIALLEAEAATLGKTRFEQDALRASEELLIAARNAGVKITPELIEHTRKLGEEYAVVAERVRLAKDQWQAANELMRTFGNSAIDGVEAIISKTKTLNQVLADTLRTFAKMAAQAALLGDGPLAALLGTKSSTGGTGGLLGSLGGGLASLLGISGFRAKGGPVNVGQSYVVGERGPEVFRPSVAGVIQTGGSPGGGPTVYMENDFRDASANAIPAIMLRIATLERAFPQMVPKAYANARRTNPWA